MQIRQKAQCELCPLTRMLAMVVSCSFWVPSEGNACSSFHAATRRGEHGGGLCAVAVLGALSGLAVLTYGAVSSQWVGQV